MELKLKWLDFKIFMIIGCSDLPVSMSSIKKEIGHIPLITADNINSVLDNLKEYILNDGNIFMLSSKGKEYLNEYNDYGSELVIDGKYDFAIMKFLFEMDELVYYSNFPKLILLKTPEDGKGMSKEFHLRDYLQMKSNYKDFYSSNQYGIALNIHGKKYYENLIAKNEKEKAEYEKEKNLKLLLVEKQVNKLEFELEDYKGIRLRSKWAFVLSILAVLISLATIILKWLGWI